MLQLDNFSLSQSFSALLMRSNWTSNPLKRPLQLQVQPQPSPPPLPQRAQRSLQSPHRSVLMGELYKTRHVLSHVFFCLNSNKLLTINFSSWVFYYCSDSWVTFAAGSLWPGLWNGSFVSSFNPFFNRSPHCSNNKCEAICSSSIILQFLMIDSSSILSLKSEVFWY